MRMREILFRGFHKDESGKEKVYVKGEWIKGYWIEGGIYYQKSDEVKEEAIYIIGGSLNDVGCAYEVISETVGQYTGLKDKNGKKIFEGDIIQTVRKGIKYEKTYQFVIKYSEYIPLEYCQAKYAEYETIGFHALDKYSQAYQLSIYSRLYDIIGNIHSNPELLEV